MKKGVVALLIFFSSILSFYGCSTCVKIIKSNPFIGTWKLITIEYQSDDGTIGFPFGKNLTGYISYNEDGYMFGLLQDNNRREFPFSAPTDNVLEEQVSLRKEFLSYCGRYEIQDKKIVHYIEVSLYTDWFGASERIYEFDGDRLILSTNPFLLDGKQTRTVAVWEKMK